MFNKSHLLGAMLALVALDDISTRIKAHKAAKLYLEANEAHERTDAAHTFQILHLCHLIDKHNVKVDEFDMIVLNFPYEANRGEM